MIKIELKIDQYETKKYYIKDTNIFHREDGPAIEYADGAKFWYQHGKFHRLDGPAVEWSDSNKYWWINDRSVSCKNQEEFENSKEYKTWKLRVFL